MRTTMLMVLTGAVAVAVTLMVQDERPAAPPAASRAEPPPASIPPEPAGDSKAIAELRARLAQRDKTIARLRDSVRDLKRAAQAGDVEPRTPAEVKAEIRKLAKEMGINLLGFLTPDAAIMKELAAMGPAGVALLSDLLRTGTDDERFAAAAILEKLGDPAAIPALAEVLFSEDQGNTLVQRMTSHAIALIGGEEAIAPLERVLDEGSEWGIKANAAYGLANMGHEGGIDWLLETYKTAEDPMAKAVLLPAMAAIGDPSYLPEMHRVLAEETEYSKRFVAVQGIVKAGQTQSLPVLEALIDDPEADRALVTAA